MKNKFFIPLVLVLFVSSLAFQWPLKNPTVTSSFGEPRPDHFHDGIDIVNADKVIHPVADAKLVYFHDHELYPFDNYTGGGNYKILQHEDQSYSLYMHMQDGQNIQKKYTVDDSLGTVGNTGRSFGAHLHFGFILSDLSASQNGLMILPPLEDLHAPDVRNFYLHLPDDSYYKIQPNSSFRLTQNYPLLIEIKDSMKYGERLGVYKLKVELNGKEVLDVTYNYLKNIENQLTFNGFNFNQIFDAKGFYKIPNVKYLNGANEVKVIASDFFGNRTETNIVFDVELDLIK